MLDTHALARAGTAVPLSASGSPRPWREIVRPYAEPDARVAVMQLLNTLLPFLAVMTAMLWGLDRGFWSALLLAVPAAALLARLFTLQHDCGHGSFFKSRRVNDLIGRTLGVLTMMPYASWRKDHALHHATSGNLDRRGTGDVTILTVREYLARPGSRRLLYRLYRHPLVLFGIGPAYLLLIRYRFPIGHPLRDWDGWLSILGTNAAAAMAIAVVSLIVGLGVVVLAWVTVLLVAESIGVWLFYIQHQFEDTYWEATSDWDFRAAALGGSSFYDLPRVLHWLTGSIGFHHIHHLASKIPNYRLRACFEQNPEFQQVERLTMLGSLKCARLALWDEDRRKLVSFRTLRRGSSLTQASTSPSETATPQQQ
jgi:omega-6 fatty acid desaturase (delta-12 desaturase)